MTDRGQARLLGADAQPVPATGYEHPFVAADSFGEARKYTALGFFTQPATGGGLVRFDAVQLAGVASVQGAVEIRIGVDGASHGVGDVQAATGLPGGLSGEVVGSSAVEERQMLATGQAGGGSQVVGGLGSNLLTNTAEGGTAGTTVTPANSGGASGSPFFDVAQAVADRVKFSNVQTRSGLLSYRLDCTQSLYTAVRWDLGTKESPRLAQRVYCYLTGYPTSATSCELMSVRTGSNATVYTVAVNQDGTVRVKNRTGSQVGATGTIPLNSWVRLEVLADRGAADGQGSLNLAFYDGDSATPLSSLSLTNLALGAANLKGINFGHLEAGTPSIAPLYFDDLAALPGAVEFLGPAPTAPGLVNLTGQPVGVGTVAASLQLELHPTGQTGGATAVAGQLGVAFPATGQVAGTSTADGQLGVAPQLAAGDITGPSSTTADLGAGRAVAGRADGAGVVTGALDVIALLALDGSTSGQASISGDLALHGLDGQIDGDATVAASAAIDLAVGGVSNGAAVAQGALQMALAPTVQVGGDSTVSAGLSVALAPSYAETVLADSPILYWRFGENSGVTAADSAGQFNNGTYVGAVDHLAPSLITTDPGNNAVRTTAVGQKITGNSPMSTSAVEPFSVELWFATSYTANEQFLYYWRTPGTTTFNSAYLIITTGGQIRGQLAMGSTDFFSAVGPVVNDGMPHHVIMTWGASTMRLYIDGQLYRTSTVNGRLSSGSMTHHVGQNPNNTSLQFFGTLDEYAVYKNLALSAARIQAHYTAAGRPPWALAGAAAAQATALADLAGLPRLLEGSAAGQASGGADLLVLLMVASAHGEAIVSLAELVRLASREFEGNVALMKALSRTWSGQVSKSSTARMPMSQRRLQQLEPVGAQRSNFV